MLENKTDHCNVQVHTDPTKFQKSVSKYRMIESQAPFYWQNYQEYEDGS